ncbi:MAG: class I SAM-dependent methyltransferase [Sphingomonas sp.]|uniref:class I SAM-dependent methyltransferase n=1 Tax=Sphingomonas sp. TaxID=28214 RepID=UPI0025E0CB66|nr:class I SAM-dependent methyltransferase [Sphingomonas sp.]MBX9883128.1 class I SAM-dependent methyltransferase [Sphingomonas sp.]
MPDLLIHSMAEFADIILGALDLAEATTLAEIGAEYGGMSALLADHVAARGGTLVSIDPAPKPEFADWLAERPQVTHLPLPSLEAIPTLAGIDAWLIDGDHNWYTVYHELRAIDAIAKRDGKPLLTFLHDIHWPVGRRDMYYAPDRIPAEFLHEHSYEGGTVPHEPFLRRNRGFRGMGHYALALHEGGPRNGVLTAVEDFLAEELEAGRELGFCEVPGVFGLGILFAFDAPWSAALADLVVPWHQNKLLQSLEANRLANYLKVIEYQDRGAA